MEDIRLSIVFGTMNRVRFLEPLLESIRSSVGGMTYEIVIVATGTDGTLEYLDEVQEVESDVRLIKQEQRMGAGRAFNAGFMAAYGKYVCNLNDDCLVVGDTLERACNLLDAQKEIGQVAIPFSLPTQPTHVDYVNLWKRKLVYANFGVTRRELGNQLGWWGTVYQYSGDTELSIKVWLANYSVTPLEGGQVIHYQENDDTRVPNVESHRIGRLYNNTKPPPILQRMGTPRAEPNYGRSTVRPKREMAIQKPARLILRKRSKQVKLVSDMTMIKYFGNGWQPIGAPTGTAYKFSNGAPAYVYDDDLEFLLSHVPSGEKVKVV